MAEYGIVKVFRAGDNWQYGFIRLLDDWGDETKEEVFFHLNFYRNIVGWEGSVPIFATEAGGHRRLPRRGDMLVFRLRAAKEKTKKASASPWSFAGRSRPPFFGQQRPVPVLQKYADDLDLGPDYSDEDDNDICDGICGQQAKLCTCAETEAFLRHNADPATRGSWFVA